jgi:hypothetical protein
MVKLHCDKCGHAWDYTGRKHDYATCPSCDGSVRIKPLGDGVNEPGDTTPAGVPDPEELVDDGDVEPEELHGLLRENNRLLQTIYKLLDERNDESE